MKRAHRGSLLAILSMLVAAPGSAQSSWEFRAVAESGLFYAVRDLGKNIGETGELVVYQVASRMDAAPVLAVGVEAWSASRSVAIRLIGSTTLGGTSSGRVAVCAVLTGPACEPRTVDARLNTLRAEAAFVQGAPSDRFRPEILLGAGARSYQFQAEPCPVESDPLVQQTCELVIGIYEDQAQVQPFVQFGLGLRTTSGRLTGFARVLDQVGPYNGGSGRAEGEIQNDVLALVGIGIRVR